MSTHETTMNRPDHAGSSTAIWIAAAMVLSMLGLISHNVREFGFMALFDIATGTLPMVIIGAAWCSYGGAYPGFVKQVPQR